METSELRRFNLVLFDGNLYQVFSVDPCFVGLSRPGKDELIDSVDVCRVSPVPLDDDVLCSWCGFNKAKWVKGRLTKHGVNLIPSGDSYYEKRTGRNITTLHQLQNFIFAVSGSDLEIIL